MDILIRLQDGDLMTALFLESLHPSALPPAIPLHRAPIVASLPPAPELECGIIEPIDT